MYLCLKFLCAKAFCAQWFLCARDFSLTVRAFWRGEQLRWVEANFEEMRKVDQCSDEMKTVEKNLLRWHVRRDGMRWEELRWGQKSSHDLRWDEVWSVKCKCEVRGVKSAVWSVRKVFAWRCVSPGSCAGHVLGQHLRNSFAQSAHARAWLAHGACKFYRWQRAYSISLRQLPPRLVRVLLVLLFCRMTLKIVYISKYAKTTSSRPLGGLNCFKPWKEKRLNFYLQHLCHVLRLWRCLM